MLTYRMTPLSLNSSRALVLAAVFMVNCGLTKTQERKHLKSKVGVILPYDSSYSWSVKRVSPGIQYAVDGIHRNDLLADFQMYYGDSQCSDTYGPLQAIDMYINRRAHVFLGPVCDYSVAPIARFSPHWNIPIITAGAHVSAFYNKTQYRLLTRISGSFQKMGGYIGTLFTHFHWDNIALIYNMHLGKNQHLGKTACFFKMEAVYLKLGPRFRETHPEKDIWFKAFDEASPDTYNFTAILMEASLRSRGEYSTTSCDNLLKYLLVLPL